MKRKIISQTNFIKFERRCRKNDIILDEKFNKLATMIQNFEKQIGDEDYDYRYLRNNCINLKYSIK